MTTPTKTLIEALRILAKDIQSEDGVANAAIAEAADRLEQQEERIRRLEQAGDLTGEWLAGVNPTISHIVDAYIAYIKTISDLNQDKAELLERINQLEQAGDAMAKWLEDSRNLGADATLSHAWRETKETK